MDMRRSFNGLYAYVQPMLSQDPLSGHLFLFTERLQAENAAFPESGHSDPIIQNFRILCSKRLQPVGYSAASGLQEAVTRWLRASAFIQELSFQRTIEFAWSGL
jgi:hypothetical protein